MNFIFTLQFYLVNLNNTNFVLCFEQSSFVGAIAIGDLIKSTLGPKGMVRTTHGSYGALNVLNSP